MTISDFVKEIKVESNEFINSKMGQREISVARRIRRVFVFTFPCLISYQLHKKSGKASQ